MSKVLNLCAGGYGDILQGLICTHFVQEKLGPENVHIQICSRDAVAEPLKYCFGGLFNTLIQHPEKSKWGDDNWILSNLHELDYLKTQYSEIYYITPDLLFRNPLAFDYKKYGVSLDTLKSHRLLTKIWNPKKEIYLGLISSTEGYVYHSIPELLIKLGAAMPDYIIHCPVIKKWAGKDIDMGNFNVNFPENVRVYVEPDFIQQLHLITDSCYGVFSDNGPSHFSFQIGQPRLLLDPKYHTNPNNLAWTARWRENIADSIPIHSLVDDVVRIIKTNILIPETQLIPRVAAMLDLDWPRHLIFKY